MAKQEKTNKEMKSFLFGLGTEINLSVECELDERFDEIALKQKNLEILICISKHESITPATLASELGIVK
jgi:hypothetical protein